MTLNPLLDQTFETTAGPRSVRQMIEGKTVTVFMAYPMDFTPVCTMQLCNYRDHWDWISALPCRFWGINQVARATHESFKEKKQLPFDLVSDKDGSLLKALGLWGLLRTKRGFAVVSPSGEVLAVSSVFPFIYEGYQKLIDFVTPYLNQEGKGVQS